MSKIYFGKISKRLPDQLENNYYAGGAEDSSWYGGMEIGDFVFPIFQGKVKKLWRVAAFENKATPINQDGLVRFEVVKEFAEPVPVSTKFVRYRHFELDLNLLNKSVKSTAKEKMGFYLIPTAESCPAPADIDFSDTRNIVIALAKPFKDIPYREGDIRILIGDKESLEINEIQAYRNGAFMEYGILRGLYLSKNPEGKRYSLKELLEYAVKDKATNKEKYLRAVVDGIQSNGYFNVTSPIKLYDNILVGRKRTAARKGSSRGVEPEIVEEEELIFSKEDYEEYQEYVDLLKFSPNLILYGPPGTGKTYSVEKIIEAFEFDRTQEEKSFQELSEEGRLRFITFHQSFSYEEFVEGLRPVTVSQDEEPAAESGNNLKYDVRPGILLQIANKAVISQLQKEFTEDEFKNVGENNTIWKVSLGSRGREEDVYQECIDNNHIAIGWLPDEDLGGWDKGQIFEALKGLNTEWSDNPTNDTDSINKFVNEIRIGDIVLIFASVSSIRAIGVVEGDYSWDQSFKYPHLRKVRWLRVFDQPVDILSYNGGKRLTMKTIYELSRLKFSDIKEMLEAGATEPLKEEKPAVPHFLIIDEINRGNISKIFGELITLVEKDKRDKVKVQLPYSQKQFALPSNLYLIGTMNTADRSIAILDTALRRRFVFKELEPDAEVIRSDNPLLEDDLDLATLLEKINVRITEKLDRDHRIGHSYFLNVYDIKQFRIVWYYQVIPLLMEYFYNDGETIASIITDAFIDKNTSQVRWINSDENFKQALLNI